MDLWSLYETHYAGVHRFVRSFVRDEALADDLVQEVFLRAHERGATLRDPERVKPWLLRIARNLCLDHQRRRRVQAAMVTAAAAEESVVPDGDGGTGSPRGEEPALQMLERQEMSRCVQDKLALLREEHRTVLTLFDVLGLTHVEVAEALDITVENAKVRLHRARAALRAVLEAHCHFSRDGRNVFVCVPRGSEDGTEPDPEHD